MSRFFSQAALKATCCPALRARHLCPDRKSVLTLSPLSFPSTPWKGTVGITVSPRSLEFPCAIQHNFRLDGNESHCATFLLDPLGVHTYWSKTVLTNRISSPRMKQRSDSFYSLFVVRTKSRPCPHSFLVPQSRALTSVPSLSLY
jgi:hypothetical protein